MKLISLNIAFGRWYESLLPFIEAESKTTDIFCIQELFDSKISDFSKEYHCRLNVFDELINILTEFNYEIRYAPSYAKYFMQELLPDGVRPCIAIFYRKGIKRISSGGFVTYKPKSTPGVNFGALLTGNLQWLLLNIDDQDYLITHLHGVYQRDTNKINTPAREYQSQKILKLLKKYDAKKILCGDFNLLPDTNSIKLLSDNYINLIEKHNITDTRGKLYDKPIRYADYMFVSDDLNVQEFKTLNVEVSDHLPLSIITG
jgi:hypothetical protein